MEKTIALLKQHDELAIIDTPLDIYLEIPHLAYIEVKKPHGGKALLFTKPVDRARGVEFDIPVLMNVFGSFRRTELIATMPPESIAAIIKDLLNLAPPKGFKAMLSALKRYAIIRYTLPKLVRHSSAQAVRYMSDSIDLYKLPILTTWEHDSAPFITMGQVYTQSLDGKRKNLGLYRLQVHSKSTLGLHWQIHKDSTHFFHEYKNAGQKMPVAIALGGDPLYTWCGQAPLPHGVYELMLYGLIKRERPRLVRCLTTPLSVPESADIIIEGYVDPKVLLDEGPFGDHTGFYTPIEPYPVLEITAITHKPSPIYPATVVGKPPLEDKYMGYLTERVFLPLLQTSAHGLLDYNMPENGVFHNLILAKIAPQYPGHAKQIMHAFWGVGQMSFVKHAIFVGDDAPELTDYPALLRYVLDRFSTSRIIISEGVCDALDHASPEYAYGGKLGLDVSAVLDSGVDSGRQDKSGSGAGFALLSDEELCLAMRNALESNQIASAQIALVRQYGTECATPIAIIGVERDSRLLDSVGVFGALVDSLRIGIFVDSHKNDLENPYMLLWRIVNNIDAKRDVRVQGEQVFIDATDKLGRATHPRAWPKETDCSLEVIQALREKGFAIDDRLLHDFHICHSPKTAESNTNSYVDSGLDSRLNSRADSVPKSSAK